MRLTVRGLKDRLFNGLPLIGDIFSQNRVDFVQRPVDMRWHYSGIVPVSTAGFNPLGRSVFFGRQSYLETFLAEDELRIDKDIDQMLYEVLFAVHDYVHIWSTYRVLEYLPHCAEPSTWSDPAALDDLAFLLVVGELVATTTLDFWLLCDLNLGRELRVRTTVGALTTAFRTSQIGETQELRPGFEVGSRRFFSWLANGYCGLGFEGFEGVDRTRLKEKAGWVIKEMDLSLRQRRLTRSWLHHLSGGFASAPKADVIFINSSTRMKILGDLEEELWDTCRRRVPLAWPSARPTPAVLGLVPSTGTDFRFNDILHVEDFERARLNPKMSIKQFGYMLSQFVSLFPYGDDVGMSADLFDEAVRNKSWSAVEEVFGSIIPALPRVGGPNLIIPS